MIREESGNQNSTTNTVKPGNTTIDNKEAIQAQIFSGSKIRNTNNNITSTTVQAFDMFHRFYRSSKKVFNHKKIITKQKKKLREVKMDLVLNWC